MNAKDVVRFINDSPTAYHAAGNISSRLGERGYEGLDPAATWNVSQGSKSMLEVDGTVIAVHVGTSPPSETGMVVVAAHTDSPGLQLKPAGAQASEGFMRVPVEVYGGPIVATWLDRELLVAGRVAVRDLNDKISVLHVRTPHPVGIIPNLAIHLDRGKNNGLSYDREQHLALLVPWNETGNVPKAGDCGRDFLEYVGASSGFNGADVVASELFAIPDQHALAIPVYGDVDDHLLVAPRIDNLAGAYTGLSALPATPLTHTNVAVWFNHEEIGNQTSPGAASTLLRRTLARIIRAVDPSPQAWERCLARSIIVSNDATHAVHPNYADKHGTGYKPMVGGGPVVKKSAIWRYLDSIDVNAWFRSVCSVAGVSVQTMQNRSDIPAGTTIGPIAAAGLGVPGIDVGIPMLAMHSSRETARYSDITMLTRALAAAYARGPR